MKVTFQHVHHKFTPYPEADAISATANTNDFTILSAICQRYGWSKELIKKASKSCNLAGEVAIVTQVKPTLLLVPKTNGKDDVTYLTEDLIAAANEIGTTILNFTHYGFSPRKKYPRKELESLFHTISNHRTKSTIQKICWGVDYRRWESLNDIMPMELRNMSDYTLARAWDGKKYYYDCSRCQQVFPLDVFLSRLLNMGETEVEIALCHDCQQKLLRHVSLPFYSPKPAHLCH